MEKIIKQSTILLEKGQDEAMIAKYQDLQRQVMASPMPSRKIMTMIDRIIREHEKEPLEVFDLCLFCFTYGQLYKNRKA